MHQANTPPFSKPRQEQPDGQPKFRALPIVAGVVIVLLFMFATYRLGKVFRTISRGGGNGSWKRYDAGHDSRKGSSWTKPQLHRSASKLLSLGVAPLLAR